MGKGKYKMELGVLVAESQLHGLILGLHHRQSFTLQCCFKDHLKNSRSVSSV